MATAYHGKTGQMMMSTTGAGAAAAVTLLSDWSLDRATDTVEVTSFGDSNKTYVQGLPDLKFTYSGFWDSANDSIFDAAESSTPVNVYLYPTTLAPSIYFYGSAYVTSSITVSVSDAVKVSGSGVAASSWGRKP